MKILIKGGRVVDPKNDFDKVADVLVDNGIISEIGENINADGDVTVIDAEGKIVSPGLVDMHSHLRDPGQEYKEDIESGFRPPYFSTASFIITTGSELYPVLK